MEFFNKDGVDYTSRSYNYATRQYELWGVAENGQVVVVNEDENLTRAEDDDQLTLELEEAKLE